MNLIPGLTSSAAQAASRSDGIKTPPEIRQPETEPQNELQPKPPVYDEYSPTEKPEPIGKYWLGKDEEGQPKIYFDEPQPAQDDVPADKPDGAPAKKPGGKKAEKCTGSTDKVDREIARLKEKKARLEQQIAAETDETKIKNLQNQLKQVEGELRQKDNDTYRRSHMQISGA